MTWIAIHSEPHGFRPAKHGNPNRCTVCGGWSEHPCHSEELWTGCDRERIAARAIVEGEELTAQMRQPLKSIERAARITERESPLFAGTQPCLF